MNKISFVLALGLLAPGFVQPARATVIFTLLDSGSDLVLFGSGTANINGLITVASQQAVVIRQNSVGFQVVAGVPASPPAPGEFVVVVGNNSIGDGSLQVAVPDPLLSSGDTFGIVKGAVTVLQLPQNYVSGTYLEASTTFKNVNIADLHLTPGIYNWTFNSGPNADNVVLYLGMVPEPGTIGIGGMGLVALIGIHRRRRSRKPVAVMLER